MENRDQREFERYPVSFSVEVSAINGQGDLFKEDAQLRDISGGGANLVTQQSDRYFIGQKVNLKIRLPGAEDLKGGMNGHGMVVWISDELDEHDAGSVGLCMENLLAFESLLAGR